MVDQGHQSAEGLKEKGTKVSSWKKKPTSSQELLDAQSVDVYKHSNGVIFLLDQNKSETVEYVINHVSTVPRDMPILVLSNFADQSIGNKEKDEFLERRLRVLRNDRGSCAPLHYIIASLTRPDCMANPASGLIDVTLKFFELPFLELQKQVLLTRLAVNDERLALAEAEWMALASRKNGDRPTSPLDSSPPQPTIQGPSPAIFNNTLRAIDRMSTDSLTSMSRHAWNAAP